MTMDMHNQLTIPAGLLVMAGLSPFFVAQFALFVSILLRVFYWGHRCLTLHIFLFLLNHYYY